MYDKFIMIAVGVVLIFAGFSAKGFAYGMAPHRDKPKYAATRRLRVVLVCFGLVSLTMGLAGALHK